jgi:hypothetical protein
MPNRNANETFFGVMDYPKEKQIVKTSFKVGGWVLTRVPNNLDIKITLDETPIPVKLHRTSRPDVLKVHKNLAAHNPKPGFIAVVDARDMTKGKCDLNCIAIVGNQSKTIGRATIYIQGDIFTADDSQSSSGLTSNRDRVLLIHIPKTAGTSLNAYLKSQFYPHQCILHAENLILGKPRNEVKGLEEKLFISAHLKIDTLRKFINTEQYFRITMLRDPAKQTLSHLAWVRRLAAAENRNEFENSPDYIKKIVERISQLDIVEFIETMDRLEKNFFDNCQTRYLLPFHGDVDLTEKHLREAIKKLNSFDVIGLTERYYDSILIIAYYLAWMPPPEEQRLNPSDKKYFIDIENVDEEVKRVFKKITQYDNALYEQAQTIFEKQVRNMLSALRVEFHDSVRQITRLDSSVNQRKLVEILTLRAKR